MSRSGVLRSFGALVSGAIFGLGLAVSGMMNPAKVIGFLDVAGDWDPTLAFVMGGALLVTVPAFRLILGRGRPVFDRSFALPDRTAVDGRLISGAALFGVGWGMVGFCPGPAVAALATGLTPVLVFVAAMVAGMALQSCQQSALSYQRRKKAEG
ncbi:YeeE/YedE family protein [Rubrobacter tropicus]|uniref:YeeE/YedE family protein n=1 Tax=Rubrobacter tropicus TaxID=2653851 RepID=A0A6G8Q652_9ACTN|nr:YeeE/YedE family protein [Rubrobacter tropicus]QIN81797.1 YeeE/YedE family protein [Rubrobacter tropicus]